MYANGVNAREKATLLQPGWTEIQHQLLSSSITMSVHNLIYF